MEPIQKAKQILAAIISERTNTPKHLDQLKVVWFNYTLGGWKILMIDQANFGSLGCPYYELTCDSETDNVYVDTYTKSSNRVVEPRDPYPYRRFGPWTDRLTPPSTKAEQIAAFQRRIDEDLLNTTKQMAPTEPGFYRYSGGAQTLLFLLTKSVDDREPNQWHVILSSGVQERCTWEYIEQALDVWDLVKIR